MGPMTYHLGNIYLSNANYKDKILNILEEISKESAESVGIAHRVGDKVISLFEVETYQIVKINDQPGTYYPMNRGCYGKCLMAYHDPEVVEKLLDDTNLWKGRTQHADHQRIHSGRICPDKGTGICRECGRSGIIYLRCWSTPA